MTVGVPDNDRHSHCHDQIRTLYEKAVAIGNELGESATDYYIQQCIQKVQKRAADGSFAIEGFENEEKIYLQQRLSKVQIPVQENLLGESPRLSPKVRILIDFLRNQEHASLSGLIFVRTRADVAVLSHLLSVHTPFLAISTFVGASSFSGRKSTIGELVDVRNQRDTLDDLRYGRKNLIVTTNALEEGIDVSTCSVVTCFDKPPNLKSFIQRRGRARKSDSKYVMMFESGPESEIVSTWTALEAEMRKLYEDDMRQVHELQRLEDLEDEDLGGRTLAIEATGYVNRRVLGSLVAVFVAHTWQRKTYPRRCCPASISFLCYSTSSILHRSESNFYLRRSLLRLCEEVYLSDRAFAKFR